MKEKSATTIVVPTRNQRKTHHFQELYNASAGMRTPNLRPTTEAAHARPVAQDSPTKSFPRRHHPLQQHYNNESSVLPDSPLGPKLALREEARNDPALLAVPHYSTLWPAVSNFPTTTLSPGENFSPRAETQRVSPSTFEGEWEIVIVDAKSEEGSGCVILARHVFPSSLCGVRKLDCRGKLVSWRIVRVPLA